MSKLQKNLTSDLSNNIIWKTLSKDVYAQNKENRSLDHATIMENSETDSLLSTGSTPKCSRKKQGASCLMTSFLLVNTALGVGILNFPAAYGQAGGIAYATGIQLVMLCLMVTTMLILAYCSDFNGDKTYHDVLLTMCGKKGQQIAAITIALCLYCVCVALLIVIGDQFDSLLFASFGSKFCTSWYMNRRYTITATAVIFILPICFCKRVDFLAPFGSVGIFAMLYPVFLSAYSYFKFDMQPEHIKTKPSDIAAMFAVFPVLGLGYQCQEVVVPVYSCMRGRNMYNFAKATISGMSFLFVIYSVTGIFGYLTFGDEVSHNIMKMYDANDPFVMVGVGTLIVKMVVTYPLLCFCGRDAVAGIYAELRGLKPEEFITTEKRRRYVIAALWFGSSLVLAVFTGGIGIVIKYLGCVSTVNIFIYPGICLMRVVMEKDPSYQKWTSQCLLILAIFITAFGAFCLGVVLLQAILGGSTETSDNLCSTYRDQ